MSSSIASASTPDHLREYLRTGEWREPGSVAVQSREGTYCVLKVKWERVGNELRNVERVELPAITKSMTLTGVHVRRVDGTDFKMMLANPICAEPGAIIGFNAQALRIELSDHLYAFPGTELEEEDEGDWDDDGDDDDDESHVCPIETSRADVVDRLMGLSINVQVKQDLKRGEWHVDPHTWGRMYESWSKRNALHRERHKRLLAEWGVEEPSCADDPEKKPDYRFPVVAGIEHGHIGDAREAFSLGRDEAPPVLWNGSCASKLAPLAEKHARNMRLLEELKKAGHLSPEKIREILAPAGEAPNPMAASDLSAGLLAMQKFGEERFAEIAGSNSATRGDSTGLTLAELHQLDVERALSAMKS